MAVIHSRQTSRTATGSWSKLEEIIERFETDWLAGCQPNIDDYLDGPNGQRTALLGELVHADLELRSRAELPVSLESYLAKYPELAGEPALLLELLVVEQDLRSAAGQSDGSGGLEHRLSSLLHRFGAATGTTNGLGLQPFGATPAEPANFGDLQLLEEIAQGGMGIVYKARQVSLNRIVALKMIRSGCFASDDELRRFHCEVQALARIRHPNIVAIHDVGEVGGQPYFSMDYVDGSVLSDLIRDGAIAPRTAAAYVETLALATEQLHQHQILHRDLKPSNILIDQAGRPIITDFGLALLTEEGSQLTRTGQLVGTPSYMPPEQIDQAASVSEASDVYSLGAILYELLVGEPPFRAATTWSTVEQVRSRPPVPPSALQADVDPDLETIALKCLEKDPARRYSTAALLAEDLRRFRANEPILARPITRAGQAWRWCRRNRIVAGFSAAMLLMLVAGTCASAYFASAAEQSKDEVHALSIETQQLAAREQVARRQSRAESERARRNAEVARRKAYNLQISRASENLLESPHLALEDLESADCPPELRDEKWHLLWKLVGRCRTKIPAHADRLTGFDLLRDGTTLVSVGYDRRIAIWDTRTGELIRTLPKQDCEVVALAVSADGTRIATANAPKTGIIAVHRPVIKLWNAETGELLRTMQDWRGAHSTISDLAFSPDGTALASGTEDFYGTHAPAVVAVWEVATGTLRFARPWHTNRVSQLDFSPDGKRLASASWDGTVKLWDAASGKLMLNFDKHGQKVLSMAFSPDGRTIASGGKDNLIRLWDASTGEERLALRGHANPVTGLDFAPDGQTVASASEDTTIKLWDAETGLMRATLTRYDGGATYVRFAPDGRTLASAGHRGTINVWEVDPGDASRVMRGHADTVNCVATVESGVVSAGNDGTMRIWSDAGHSSTIAQRDRKLAIRTLSASQDGRLVASAMHWQTEAVVHSTKDQRQATWFRGHRRPVLQVVLSPDGSTLATATDRGVIRIFDTATRLLRSQIETHDGRLTCLLWRDDGNVLASGKRDTIRLWDAASGQQISSATFPSHIVAAQLIDSERIAVAGEDHSIAICDVQQGTVLRHLGRHAEGVTSVAISDDRRTLAAGGADWTIKLWDVDSGAALSTLTGHTDEVTCVAFRPNGQLVSASKDRTVRLWSVR